MLNFFSTFIAGMIIEKTGRKKLFFTGNFIVLSALLLGYPLEWITGSLQLSYMIVYNLFMIGFGLSFGGVIWVYWADLLPANGIAFSITINYVFALVIG